MILIHLYRVNVDWKILQRNYRAYLKAGGLAWWQFIIFEHNEHEVHLVEEYAKNEGFEKVKFIGSVRPSTEVVNLLKIKRQGQIQPIQKLFLLVIKLKNRNTVCLSAIMELFPCCWIATKAGLSRCMVKK